MCKLRFVLSCSPLLLVVVSILSCGANYGQLKSISIGPAAALGQVQFTATGTYSDGSKVSSLPVLWSEGNPWVSSDSRASRHCGAQSGLASCNPVVGTFAVVATAPVDPHPRIADGADDAASSRNGAADLSVKDIIS